MKNRKSEHVPTSLTIAVSPVYSPRTPYQDQLREQLEDQGITVHDFKTAAILLKRMIHRCNIDILHLHWIDPFFIQESKAQTWFNAFVFLAKLCVIRLAGIKIVWTMHNLKDHEEPYPLLSHAVRKFVAKVSSGIIVHSQFAYKIVSEDLGASVKKKLNIVPHGHFIDCYPNNISRTQARDTLDIANDTFVYLFFGAIREYKGVDTLIQAFKKLDNPAAAMLIAGNPLNQDIEKKLSALIGDNDKILFIPKFIEPGNIQLYMNACDVVVFPYRKILTSGAVILAMSFGRACIAPKIGCISDVLDEQGAFLYNGGDDDRQLPAAMRRAFENRDLIEQFGLHNRKQVESWNWDKIANMTIQIYHRVLNR